VHSPHSLPAFPRTRDLPAETLYVLDGTAMLFQAFHSKEHTYQHAGATLAEPLAAVLRAELQLDMAAYRAEASALRSSKAPGNGNGKGKGKAKANGKGAADAAPAVLLEAPVSAASAEPAAADDERLFCGALVVMALTFARFVKAVQPRYVAVAFDAGRRTFRNEIFGAYKAHRGKPPLALAPLFGLAPRVFGALGARCLQQAGFEADDVMASLSHWARQRGLHVVHVSSDKDMLQLVDPCVHVLDPTQAGRDTQLTGAAEVHRKYNVHAAQLADYLALVGDSADNIPGVRGVGPKQAAALLKHFGSIDAMISTLALPAQSVDLASHPAVLAAGLALVQVQVPAKKSRSKLPEAAGAAPAAQLWKVQFDEKALQEVEVCMRRAGNFGDPSKLLAKLVQTGATQLRLFQTLVRLHARLAPASMVLGTDPPPAGKELGANFFLFSGEARGPPLTEISARLEGAAAMLRRQ